jgi:glycosyltransferase involved in cell wall biosynthesis
VLDACGDASADVAAAFGVDLLHVNLRNVGGARAAGAAHLIGLGARWLAFTDADTRVSPGWLAEQQSVAAEGADAVCGCVTPDDWTRHPTPVRARYEQLYRHMDGHRHVHGANLGVATAAYLRAGGFPALACSEDVALVDALAASGARIAWSARPQVLTSTRHDGRARGGFADYLLALHRPRPAIS